MELADLEAIPAVLLMNEQVCTGDGWMMGAMEGWIGEWMGGRMRIVMAAAAAIDGPTKATDLPHAALILHIPISPPPNHQHLKPNPLKKTGARLPEVPHQGGGVAGGEELPGQAGGHVQGPQPRGPHQPSGPRCVWPLAFGFSGLVVMRLACALA